MQVEAAPIDEDRALTGPIPFLDVDRERSSFTVHLIPETLRVTTFDEKDVGGRVNFEIERRTQVIVDTVRELFAEYVRSGELTAATVVT